MKRIKLTESQVEMLKLHEGRIDIEKTIEPEVNEINNTLADIAKRLRTMTVPRVISNPSVMQDMVRALEPLDDRIYDLSNKVDSFNDNPQYTNLDKYIVKTLNGLEFKRRELARIATALSNLAEASKLAGNPEVFDKMFK